MDSAADYDNSALSIGDADTYTITGLTPLELYNVKIDAKNSFGSGGMSPESSFFAGVPVVPTAPGDPTISDVS